MIVGRKFVWLHFPKSGGHAVDQALKSALKGQGEAAFDPPDYSGWHDSLEDRQRRVPGLQLAGKTVISGFRRLPFWMLSRVHYEAARPPYLAATREMLRNGEFFHQNGHVGRADDYAAHYAGQVDRWVRTEHMAEDFERHFADILGSHLARAAVRKVQRVVNGSQLNYIRELDFHFTPEELEKLYAANPLWADLERKLYGDLLRLEDRRLQRFYFVDRKLRFVAASPTALRTWGKSAEEVLGKHLLAAFPLARGTEPYLAHLRALRTMRAFEIETMSPTLAEPVRVKYAPRAAGIQVNFELLGPS